MTYKTGIIYRIQHTQSDLCYVGMTMDILAKRWYSHSVLYKKENSRGEVSIYTPMREHGIENFKIMVIKEYEVVDKQHLKVFETLWINKLNCINKKVSFNPIPKKLLAKIQHSKFKALAKLGAESLGVSVLQAFKKNY